MYQCLVRRTSYQAVAQLCEAGVFDGVECEKAVHLHVVSQFALLRVSQSYLLVVHLAVEISVVAQHALRHGGAQLAVGVAHQHGLFPESPRHPFCDFPVRLRECVPHPQAYRKRRTHRRAPEQRAVGPACQHRLDLLLRRCGIFVLLEVCVFYLFRSHIQLLPVAERARGGTGSHDHRAAHCHGRHRDCPRPILFPSFHLLCCLSCRAQSAVCRGSSFRCRSPS